MPAKGFISLLGLIALYLIPSARAGDPGFIFCDSETVGQEFFTLTSESTFGGNVGVGVWDQTNPPVRSVSCYHCVANYEVINGTYVITTHGDGSETYGHNAGERVQMVIPKQLMNPNQTGQVKMIRGSESQPIIFNHCSSTRFVPALLSHFR